VTAHIYQPLIFFPNTKSIARPPIHKTHDKNLLPTATTIEHPTTTTNLPPPRDLTMPSNCANCNTLSTPSAPLKDCSACKTASYCNSACQHADWKFHKSICKATRDFDALIASAEALSMESGERSERSEVNESKESDKRGEADQSTASQTAAASSSNDALVIIKDTFTSFDEYADYFEGNAYAPKPVVADKVFVPEGETGGWKEVEGEEKERLLKGQSGVSPEWQRG
jgi:hypothetical protein